MFVRAHTESVGTGDVRTLRAQAGLFSSSSNISFTHCCCWIPYCVILPCYTVDPFLHSYLPLCVTHTHRHATHKHTHTFQNTKHTPQLGWSAVQNERYRVVLSLLITASQRQKHTFTLADSNRLTQFISISIIKVIYHIWVFFLSRQIEWVNLGAYLLVYLADDGLLSF